MELFIIIVAIIAIVAALFLLLLLQIRIKKHSQENTDTTATYDTCLEEIAAPDPNDPYCKTGPPPYIEVMKSPELYPLSSIAFSDTKIQILPQMCPDNKHSKRTWAQLMTAVLRSESLVPNSPPEKNTAVNELATEQETDTAPVDSTKEFSVQETSVRVTVTNDDRLPSYDEVCSGRISEHAIVGQRSCSIQSSESELGQCKLLGYNELSGRMDDNETNHAFTVSNTLERVIVDAAISRTRTSTE